MAKESNEKGTKLIAMGQIIRVTEPGEHGDRAKGVPAKKPKVQTIMPGTVFMSSGEELKALREANAVRDWSEEDEKAFSRMSNVVGGGEFDEAINQNADRNDTSGSTASMKATSTKSGGTAGQAGSKSGQAASKSTPTNTDVV